MDTTQTQSVPVNPGVLANAAQKKNIFADLSTLKISFGDSVLGGVTEVLSRVPVGKPTRQEFIKVNSDQDKMLATWIYEDKEERKIFLVAPEMIHELVGEVKPALLVLTINRQNVVGIWPVMLPGDAGSNDWQESARQAAELAKKKWVRVASDMSLGAYRIYEAQGELSEPEWPKKPFNELLEIAFRGRVIDSEDHPAIKRLRGRV
jgi:hypothetical protein